MFVYPLSVCLTAMALCEYNGEELEVGDTVPSEDGCNEWCVCVCVLCLCVCACLCHYTMYQICNV